MADLTPPDPSGTAPADTVGAEFLSSLGDPALRAADRAERALRARDEFLAAAAHELRTPLTALLGIAQLALRRLDRGETLLEADQRHVLDQVVRQAKRLSRLVAVLLDTTWLERGSIVLDRRRENLAALVREAAAAMRPLTLQHRLAVHAPPHVPALVDPDRITHVLMSLIDNAIKYTSPDSSIVVRLESPADGYSPDSARPDEPLCVTVTDDGPGVPPEHRERIFERYYRGDSPASPTGLGLGLYLCREIARAHGGDLVAIFPDEGGACFELQLPAPAHG